MSDATLPLLRQIVKLKSERKIRRNMKDYWGASNVGQIIMVLQRPDILDSEQQRRGGIGELRPKLKSRNFVTRLELRTASCGTVGTDWNKGG